MDIIATARELFENQSFPSSELNIFINILKSADDLYHNGEESFLTDPEYDFLRQYAENLNPSHVYFTGIGSDVRGGKVKLPYTMGSLDQVYEGEVEAWVKKYDLAEEFVVLTDKLDGTSGMIVYGEDGGLQIAYSRGNGTEGADITRHISKIRNVPDNCNEAVDVRGEVIIEVSTFPFIRAQIKTRAGKEYKNPRNMVAGLMNSKKNEKVAYDFIKFVAYQIVGSTKSKQEQLIELEIMGFEVPHSLAVRGKDLNDEFLTKHLNLRRQDSVYEIDGLVADVNSAEKRDEMNPTRDTLNPAYAIKYKVADVNNVAIADVIEVDWNVSKHGFLKPRINIKPIELGGVTISYCTGFNAKFIHDNYIGPGAKIQITRSGDVIPFCQKVIKGVVPQMPGSHDPAQIDWNWEWNETGVDAVLIDRHGNAEIIIKQMIDFFDKIDAPMLKDGNVQKLYEADYKTVESIIMASSGELVKVLGENGNKAFDGLHEKLNNVPLHKIMGAYSKERGIGVRKMKKLQKALGAQELMRCNDPDVIANVDGFDTKSAEKTVIVIGDFIEFFSQVCDFVIIAEDEVVGTTFENEKVCMTGFRDKDLAAAVEAAGGTIQSSVSGKTTIVVCKDPTSNSGKVKKARDLGIPIIGIDELKARLGV